MTSHSIFIETYQKAAEFLLSVDWSALMTSLFTGATAVIAWRAMKQQQSRELPSVFLEIEEFDNGIVLEVSIRNRYDHPIRATTIKVLKPRHVCLAPVWTTAVGTTSDGRSHNWVSYKGNTPAREWPLKMELGSRSRSDYGKREYVILTRSKKPTAITVDVVFDPSEGAENFGG